MRRRLGHKPIEADAARLATLLGRTPEGGNVPAPASAQYLVLTADGDLTAERVFTPGICLTGTDAGANSTYTVDVNTAAPGNIQSDDSAAEGSADSVARSDHVHGIVCAVAGSIEPDDSAAEGTATSFARSDHVHGIVCAAPAVNLSVSSSNAEGSATSFARSDHGHAITSSSNPGAAASILATDASGYVQVVGLGIGAAPGSADLHFGTGRGITHADGVAAGQFLRADGTRYVPDTLDVADLTDLAYAVPALTFDTANAAGVADTVIRSDATLALFDATVPDVIQCDDSAAAGSAGVAARRDHTHGIVCAAPAVNLSVSSSNAEGTATSFARSDHSHAVDTSDNPGAAASVLATEAHGYLTLVRVIVDDMVVLDTGWVGLPGPMGRLVFASTPTPDQIQVTTADLYFATSTYGIIHVDGNTAGYVLRANGTRFVPSAIQAGDLPGSFAGFANPTASVGLSAVNGSATTAMRSDAAPALSQNITPTWTGAHTFNVNIACGAGVTVDGVDVGSHAHTGGTGGAQLDWDTCWSDAVHNHSSAGEGGALIDLNGAADALVLDADGDTTISAPTDDRIDIEVAGADDFAFTANTFDVLTGSNIRMADGSWAGLGSGAGRIIFDNTTNDGLRFLNCIIYVNDLTDNGRMVRGITINQGTDDNEILAVKSTTDVAHPMTGQAETDTYGVFRKAEGAAGGLAIIGYKSAAGAAGYALALAGRLGEAADTTKTTAATGVVTIDASVTDGGTGITTIGADGNLVVIRNHATARYIFDAEGSAHSDVEWTTFDEYDDVALLSDFEMAMLALQDPVKAEFADFLMYNRRDLERAGIVHFDMEDPGRAMVNFTRLSMLLVGAVRQMEARIQ